MLDTLLLESGIGADEEALRRLFRAEARRHRIAERLTQGYARDDAERFADAVDAWLRRLDAEDRLELMLAAAEP